MNLATLPDEMRLNPFPYYEMARAMAPMIYNDAMASWNLFSYNEIVAVLKHHQRFSSDFARFMPEAARAQQRAASMLFSDPPRHTQLRALVSQAFTPRRVAAIEPRIRQIADELLDAVIASGRIDLVEDLAYPLPVIIIAELLGVPAADRERFKRWSDVIVANLGQDLRSPEPLPEVREVEGQFLAYFTDQIEDHRRHRRDDLIGALLQAEIDGRRLEADEVLTFCVLLLVAGNETTTNLIGNVGRCFLDFPEAQREVRQDLDLVPSAIEETLRFRSPVQVTGRIAAEDTEILGRRVQHGQRVLLWLAAANRDPAEFPDPATFQVRRNPNRHVAFGHGVHFCLGAPLARLEAKAAVAALLRRIPAFERADGVPLKPVDGFIMHGVKSLPLVFDPAQALAA